jgi:hexosaminidase
MKKLINLIVAIPFLFLGCSNTNTNSSASYSIIPAPLTLQELPGNFEFTGKSKIVISDLNDENRIAGDFLAHLVKNPSGLAIPIVQGDKVSSGSVLMLTDKTVNNPEGYILKVNKGNIVIKARTGAGFFYAVQTIRQLLPVSVEKDSVIQKIRLTVPACEITDEPRFSYRGMHLDVCRHMFPVEYIKRYIDMMALHKLNTFHWHLTDDQGWRIEIKKYPKLTEIGSMRKETVVGKPGKNAVYDGKPYGGFYSQEEIKEVIAYARSRFINVIPEIEMPGHSLAALTAYPQLSCSGGPFEVGKTWGVFNDVFCPGKEETFKFIEDVLTEVCEIFPSKYIHIGGDECPKVRWDNCKDCQKRIKAEGLKDTKELQSYFIKRIEKFLISKNKRLIGWDEILEGGLAPEATVMSWRGVNGGIEAARQNHDVIMSPNQYAYLDYYQAEPAGEPMAIGGYLPLENVYAFDPQFPELNPEQQKHILGVQGNLWTEYIPTPQQMEYMAYPRMFAISETGWTMARKKDFEDFLARIAILRERYDKTGINYFKGEYRNTRTIKR